MPGHYRKRGDNSYQLIVTLGTDFTGRPQRYTRTVHVDTDKKAERELAIFYAECENGALPKPNMMTVRDLSDMCMEKVFRPTLRENTIYGYETASSRLDMIGDIRLNKLTALKIQEWVNYMSCEWESERTDKKGLSPKTVQHTFAYLNRCINLAVKWGFMQNNPCKQVELPKLTRQEPKYFKEEEMLQFIQVLYDLPEDQMWIRVAALLMLFGSFRKGELMGLNEDDFDFDRNIVTSRRTRYYRKGGGIFTDETKNESSHRVVALPAEVMDEVKALIEYDQKRRDDLREYWEDTPALLKGDLGGPMIPHRVYMGIHRILEQHGFTNVGLHGLRHTHASMIINMGESLPDVSRRLGHKYQSTTLNIYSHIFSDTDGRLAGKLSDRYLATKLATN